MKRTRSLQLLASVTVCLLLLLILPACRPAASPTSTPVPEQTAVPTRIAAIPSPSVTPSPTATQTNTPTAAVPTPTLSPIPTSSRTHNRELPGPSYSFEIEPTRIPDIIIPTYSPSSLVARGTIEPNQAEALAVILESEDNLANLQTLFLTTHVTRTRYFDGSSTRSDVVVRQTCQLRLPNDSYCVSERTTTLFQAMTGEILAGPVTVTNETVVLNNRIWLRLLEEEEWNEVTAEAFASLISEDQELSHLILSPYISDASLLGEATLNGRNAYMIDFSITIPKYFHIVFGEETKHIVSVREDDNTLWIDTETGLLIQDRINLYFTVDTAGDNAYARWSIGAYIVTTYYGFNEPVEIPDPTEP
jgi:hypothetical protein